MFGTKKPPPAVKFDGVDNLIRKLKELPAVVDLIVAAVLGSYSFVAIYVDHAVLVGLVCMLLSLVFAMLGIIAEMQEMKFFKVVERASSRHALQNMNLMQFENYIIALFRLDGFSVRPAIDELQRQDDADLIVVRKKETILVQMNHWDEDRVGTKPIQSLHKAAAAIHADGATVISFGHFTQEAKVLAGRKGIALIGMKELLGMASRLTGIEVEPSSLVEEQPELAAEQEHGASEISSSPRRFLFVDFAGIDSGLVRLTELLMQHPAYHVVASTLPPQKTLEDIGLSLGDCANRLIGGLEPVEDGRYYAIQKHLQATPEGKHAEWLAVDSEPRLFPEGCTEVIAINRSFGFDSSVENRLLDAMLLVDRRATPLTG